MKSDDDVLVLAEGNHLTFLLPVEQVHVALHGNKGGRPWPAATNWAFSNCQAYVVLAPR